MKLRRHCRCPAILAAIAAMTMASGAGVSRAETIWISAGQAKQLSGPIVSGQKTGVVEEGALGDFLVSTVCVTPEKPGDGYAEFRVKIPKTCTWYVWARLRYPSGRAESFALAAEGETPTGDIRRALGNSGIGTRQWHWDSQGTGPDCRPGTGRLRVELAAGDRTIRIYAREADYSVFRPGRWLMARPCFTPRLNVLCLTTDSGYVPADADATTALGLKVTAIDPEALKVKSVSLPAVSLDELRSSGKKRIPDWLRCPRFFTKDSWRSELASRYAGDIASMVRQIAANEGSAFRLSAYWGGDAYFQSNVTSHAPGLGSLDYLREAVAEGSRTGVKIVMYINPNALMAGHPLCGEAAVRLAHGEPAPAAAYGIQGARYVCINNPKYRDFLARLLAEAFERYDLAGLYVDGLTPHRCFCRHCRDKYHEMFGQAMPVETLAKGRDWCVLWEMVSRPEWVGDPEDPDTQRYTEFLSKSLGEVTQLLSKTVKHCRPEAVTIFHSWPKPDTMDCYDGTLTEIYVSQPWRHKLWKFGELANYSNIFPSPVLFNIYLHDHGTEAEARTKLIQGLANGCYPNCWNIVGMRPIFRFMRENAECFDFLRTRPVRFIALPRRLHDSTAQQQLKARNGASGKTVHDRFLSPYVGLYSAVVRQGLPIVTLQSADFHEHLDGFRVLCLANEACLSDRQIGAVRKFVAAGGGLIATHETSLYDEKGRRRGDFALADVLGVHCERALPAGARAIRITARHAVTAGLDAAGPLAHDDAHLVVSLAGATQLAELVDGATEPKPAPAIVTHSYGSGRVVYLPGRWDAMQCDRPTPAIERCLANAVRWVAGGSVPLEVTARAPVGASLFEQPDRRILHLVNLNGDTEYHSDRIQPLGPVRVRLAIPKDRQVRQLRRLWAKADLPLRMAGSGEEGTEKWGTERSRQSRMTGSQLEFTLEDMGEYEVVVAEFEPRGH